MTKSRIAHLTGPRATIQNSPPLVTSNKARDKRRLPPRLNPDGTRPAFDALRAQRLAAPARVYVEQFSAHPLEADAAELYGPPDGYLDAEGRFHPERTNEADKPVYEVDLHPDDGLYPLPYMAVQADGTAWEEECAAPGAPPERARQVFYPDGARSFEEVDRLAVREDGTANAVSSVAAVEFHRSVPPGGYTKGLPARLRTDRGEGDIVPEARGRDFFPYKPYHLGAAPPRTALAALANDTQAAVDCGRYDGVLWTQGSPQIEEGAYWLSLTVDTALPVCVTAAHRQHGSISADGPKNIADAVNYIASRIWADGDGRDRCGVVVLQDQQVFAAREVAKVDARPGGFAATGGHGGVLGQVSYLGRFALTYLPAYKHTHRSDVNLTRLPSEVFATRTVDGKLAAVPVAVKDAAGRLLGEAVPAVSILKEGNYFDLDADEPGENGDLVAAIARKLSTGRLGGFVVEGVVPNGASPSPARQALTLAAVHRGLPVVRVGRNAPEGFADRHPLFISGSNLTATKARLLLMACLLRFGSLPCAASPEAPTPAELARTREAVAAYQAVFDTH